MSLSFHLLHGYPHPFICHLDLVSISSYFCLRCSCPCLFACYIHVFILSLTTAMVLSFLSLYRCSTYFLNVLDNSFTTLKLSLSQCSCYFICYINAFILSFFTLIPSSSHLLPQCLILLLTMSMSSSLHLLPQCPRPFTLYADDIILVNV